MKWVLLECPYCGEKRRRFQSWSTQTFSPVCLRPECRQKLLSENGRRGGLAGDTARRSAARKAAWDRKKAAEAGR